MAYILLDWNPACTGDVLVAPSTLVSVYRDAGLGLFLKHDAPAGTFVAMMEQPNLVSI